MLDTLKIPAWLKPLADAEETKIRSANERRRSELAARRAEVVRRHDSDVPKLAKATAAAEKRHTELREALAHARQAEAEARGAEFGAGIARDAQVARLDIELRELADPRIREAIAEMRDLYDRERATPAESDRAPTGTRTVGGRVLFDVLSNAASVRDRLAAIRHAVTELEELQTTADVDVEAAIAAIRAKIPERGPLEPVAKAVALPEPV